MLRISPRFDRPSPASGRNTLARIYDAAETGWQDGISKLGFVEAYSDLMGQCPNTSVPHPKVMDVGTGTGAFASAWINAHGAPAALTLTDISPAMLASATSRLPGARAIHAGLGTAMPDVPPQNVVLCAHVIEHLDDPIAALGWLFDRLTPGGHLVMALSKPHWCTAFVRWRWGNAAYPPQKVQSMLARAGFCDIGAYPFAKGPPSRVSHGYIARRP
ncbi:MAG: class I SAM-dependent methyltransferase [Tateyamaria sp.]|jgi:ubiquinone/menaquinone biosynthesis C-methylase UbiE|uniref:class I SAM-dependent methyltransferase n=1 Tax=Tateyamaria sp. TaxID=1929288 RepID=UPI0032DCFE89